MQLYSFIENEAFENNNLNTESDSRSLNSSTTKHSDKNISAPDGEAFTSRNVSKRNTLHVVEEDLKTQLFKNYTTFSTSFFVRCKTAQLQTVTLLNDGLNLSSIVNIISENNLCLHCTFRKYNNA